VIDAPCAWCTSVNRVCMMCNRQQSRFNDRRRVLHGISTIYTCTDQSSGLLRASFFVSLPAMTDDGSPCVKDKLDKCVCICIVLHLIRNAHARASCPSQPHYETMSVVTSITDQSILPRRKRVDCFAWTVADLELPTYFQALEDKIFSIVWKKSNKI